MRILIVEDEFLIAFDLSLALQEQGHDVVGPAAMLVDALAAVEREALDAALLDINLSGGETSFPVADALMARGVPFAFLTGYEEFSLPGRLAHSTRLVKPVEADDLDAVLKTLTRSGGRQERPEG